MSGCSFRIPFPAMNYNLSLWGTERIGFETIESSMR